MILHVIRKKIIICAIIILSCEHGMRYYPSGSRGQIDIHVSILGDQFLALHIHVTLMAVSHVDVHLVRVSINRKGLPLSVMIQK